jgi:thiamine pyrophosphate-dependent acetolactate synthase large subunit-like protein
MIGPDYVALAKAYGGDGIRLEKSSDAERVVRMALAKQGLFLIHVTVDPKLKADMATFSDNSITLMNSG